MRIGINGRFLVAKQTGVQRAAHNMIATLVKIDRSNEYFLFTGSGEKDKAEWQFPHIKVIASNIREGDTLRNLIWEQITLPRLAAEYKCDILHSPANMAPLFYRGKSIIHIHDLCFIVNPQWYRWTFRTWYKIVIPRLARKSAKVLTNSNNSRNDLIQYCDVDVRNVRLVYWSVDDAFFEKEDDSDWNITDYILYVGSLEPRKNIKTLVEAFEKLRCDGKSRRTKLVLIGGESPLFAAVTLNLKDFKDDIIFKGFVTEPMLRKYYRHASLFVYPSLYEGFGLPPLEAMASGTAVVTSTTSSIPEVVGDAAIKVNPRSAGQLSRAMAKVLDDGELRNSLIARGHKQARAFNWYRVARDILATYHEVHSGSHISLEKWKELRNIEQRALH